MTLCQLLLQIGHGIGLFEKDNISKQQTVQIEGDSNMKNRTKELKGVVTKQQEDLSLITTDQLIQKRWRKAALATKPLGIIEEANTVECDRWSKPSYDEYSKQIICITAETLNTDCISPEGNILKEWEVFVGFKPWDTSCKKEERICQQWQLRGDNQYILASCQPSTTKNNCIQKDGTLVPENSYTVLFKDTIVDKDQDCNFVESICTNGVLQNKHGFIAESCQFTNSFSSEYISIKPWIINDKWEIDNKYLKAKTDKQNAQNCTLPRWEILNHGKSRYTFKQERVPFEEFCTFSIVECNDGVFIWWQIYQYPNCQIGEGKSCSLQGKTIKNGETITAYKKGILQKNGQYICPEEQRTCIDWTLNGNENYNLTLCRLGEVGKARCENPRGGTAIEHNKSIIAYKNATVQYGQNCNTIAEKRFCNNGTLWGSYTHSSCSVEQGKSCTTPWHTTLKDWEKIKAYKKPSYNFSEDCNSENLSERRTCENWTLKGSYIYWICNKQEPQGCQLPDKTEMQHGSVVTLYQYNEVYGEAEDGVDICPRQVRKCNDGSWIDFNNQKSPFSFQYKQCNVIPPNRQ